MKKNKKTALVLMILGMNYLDYEFPTVSAIDEFGKMDIGDIKGIIQQLAAETEGYI